MYATLAIYVFMGLLQEFRTNLKITKINLNLVYNSCHLLDYIKFDVFVLDKFRKNSNNSIAFQQDKEDYVKF